MDQILNNNWRKSLKPFTGDILYCKDLMEIDNLRFNIEFVCQKLEKLFSNEPIYKIHDWHEHDGYISNPTQTSWKEILNLFRSSSTLYESRSGEDFVRVGIYSQSCEFYFRYYLPDEDDDPEFYPGFWGEFDICGSINFVQNFFNQLRDLTTSNNKLKVKNSLVYFNDNWAG